MGLFKSFRSQPELEFDTQRAVMTIVISALLADGDADDEEVARMRSMCERSTIFNANSKDADDKVIEFALRVIRQQGLQAVDSAAKALPASLRETAFAYAVEVVLADGQVGEEEEAFIDALAQQLRIDEGLAQAIIGVTLIRARGEV